MRDNNDINNEFPDFLGKYNEYLRNGSNNKNGDRTFLDRKEQPTDDMIINLFITEDDMQHALDISDYNIKKLGKPDDVKTIEGTEWVLSKLVVPSCKSNTICSYTFATSTLVKSNSFSSEVTTFVNNGTAPYNLTKLK